MTKVAEQPARTFESIMQGYFEEFVRPDAPELTYESLRAPANVPGRHAEGVDATVTRSEVLADDEATYTFTGNERRLPRLRSAMATLGLSALAVVAVVGGDSVIHDLRHDSPTSGVSTEPTVTQRTTASTVSTTTTTEATTNTSTTTTEAPSKPYEANVGDIIGVLDMPQVCLKVEVVEFDEETDKTTSGAVGESEYAPGALINRLDKDPSPVLSCDNVAQSSVSQVPGYKDRTQWVRRNGHINAYKPIAGFQASHNDNGEVLPNTPYPGQIGNAVIEGHGSTESGPFTDIGVFKPGDRISFTRSDGVRLVYVNTGSAIVYPEQYNEKILNYTSPLSTSTLTMYRCAYPNGNPGSDEMRLVEYFALVA